MGKLGISAPIALIVLAFATIAFKNLEPNFGKNLNQVDTNYRECIGKSNLYQCLEDFLLNTLKNQGPKPALAALTQAGNENTQILSLCHPLVHKIGRESFNITKNAVESFSVGDETCANGFYHGVLEGYLTQAPKLENAVVDVCKSTGEVSGYMYFQCIHGLGHGLMFKTGDDVKQSLVYCDLLETGYDRESCYGGVFMQNIVNDFPYSTGHGQPVLKKEDPLYPCNDETIVSEKYKSACYFLVTSQIMKVTYPDWKAMAGWCDKVEEKYRFYCYQSMGRDISGATLRDPQKGYEACKTSDPKYLADCVIGFAKDLLEYDPKNPAAKVFCDLVDESVKPSCFNGLGQMIYSIYTSSTERVKACQNLTSKHLDSCLLKVSI